MPLPERQGPSLDLHPAGRHWPEVSCLGSKGTHRLDGPDERLGLLVGRGIRREALIMVDLPEHR